MSTSSRIYISFAVLLVAAVAAGGWFLVTIPTAPLVRDPRPLEDTAQVSGKTITEPIDFSKGSVDLQSSSASPLSPAPSLPSTTINTPPAGDTPPQASTYSPGTGQGSADALGGAQAPASGIMQANATGIPQSPAPLSGAQANTTETPQLSAPSSGMTGDSASTGSATPQTATAEALTTALAETTNNFSANATNPSFAVGVANNGTAAKNAESGIPVVTQAPPSPPKTPLILYGKGKATQQGTVKGRTVTGDPVDTNALFGSGEERLAVAQHSNAKYAPSKLPTAGPTGEDALIRLAFIEDLAKFLVENYWPAGTHPAARLKGITSASPKWMNMRYGSQLQGFGVSSNNGSAGRQKVLNYALSPSMVNSLYVLYNQRFFIALNTALAERRVPTAEGTRPLTPAEIAEMYSLYASKLASVSGAINAYYKSSAIPELLEKLQVAESTAASAYYQLFERMQVAPYQKHAEQQALYQEAVMRRAQAHTNIAAAMRRNGNTRSMDGDTLVYIAAWVHRRGPGAAQGLLALASIFDRLAVHLEQEELQWQSANQ